MNKFNWKLFINLKPFKIVAINLMSQYNLKSVLKNWNNFQNLVKEIQVKQ